MAINDKKGQWILADNVRKTFIAGEALSYEDKVALQPDGKTLLKDANGAYQVFFPKSVEAGEQVDVVELVAGTGGGASGGSDSDWLNNADDSAPSDINNPIYRNGPVSIGTKDSDEAIKIVADDVGVQNESNIVIDQYSNANGRAGAYILRRSRGSEAAPEPVLAGNNLGVFQFRGWRGDNWQTAGVLQCSPVNDWIDGDASTRNAQYLFRVADQGSVRTRMILSPEGLTIDPENANDSGLTFADLNSSSPATSVAATLGVDLNGKVVVASSNVSGFDRQIVSLVANTPLTITSTLTDIYSIQVYDSLGEKIDLRIAKTTNANERVLESNINLTDVIVEMIGSN